MTTYKFEPGRVASFLGLRIDDCPPVSCVYVSKEKGVLVGAGDKPLASMGWPTEVQAEINKHFGTVFSLPHENWKGRVPSPRAVFLDHVLPWTLDIEQ